MDNYLKNELSTDLELRKKYEELGDLISSYLIDSDDDKDVSVAEYIFNAIES
jgi:hypothetical protein